jgi:hypothetical protein
VDELDASVADTGAQLSGTLRLAVPLSFGLGHLAPAIDEFLETHPDLDVNIDFSDRKIDLVERGVELAIRIAELDDSSLQARRICPIRMVLCASPAYLAAHGEPEHPRELDGHRVLLYDSGSSQSLRMLDENGTWYPGAHASWPTTVISCVTWPRPATESATLRPLLPGKRCVTVTWCRYSNRSSSRHRRRGPYTPATVTFHAGPGPLSISWWTVLVKTPTGMTGSGVYNKNRWNDRNISTMKRYILFITLLVSTALCAPLSAEQLVREFAGSRTTQTAEFEVKAPWLIDWRVNSEFEDSMGLAVVLLNSPTGTHAGTVLKTKYRGNGLRLMEESGRFTFKVDAVLANWTIKVIQLTPEEAKLYTPKQKSLL